MGATWEDVQPPPAGNFIGWGVRPGQHVTGEVMAYSPTGGTDYNKNPCPQLEVELTERAYSFNKKLEHTHHDPPTRVTLTCGLYELRRLVEEANPARGDLVKIVLDGTEDIEGGNTVKRFSMKINRGGGQAKGRGNVRVVETNDVDFGASAKSAPDSDPWATGAPTKAADDSDDIPF